MNAQLHATATVAPRPRPDAPLAGMLGALAVAAALAACGPNPGPSASPSRESTVGQKIDSAVASTNHAVAETKADAKQAADNIGNETKQVADRAVAAVSDAAITAAVNAKLAADPALSALRINVDTESGRVAMRGDAPDAAARERATELARSVDGVKSVDNRLTLQKG